MNQELMLGGPDQIYGFHMISSDFDLQDQGFWELWKSIRIGITYTLED